jgi:hypothetical protein
MSTVKRSLSPALWESFGANGLQCDERPYHVHQQRARLHRGPNLLPTAVEYRLHEAFHGISSFDAPRITVRQPPVVTNFTAMTGAPFTVHASRCTLHDPRPLEPN